MTIKHRLKLTDVHPLSTLLGILGFTLLVPLLLSACGTNKAPSSPTIDALTKAAPYKRGVPALVFVYTDG